MRQQCHLSRRAGKTPSLSGGPAPEPLFSSLYSYRYDIGIADRPRKVLFRFPVPSLVMLNSRWFAASALASSPDQVEAKLRERAMSSALSELDVPMSDQPVDFRAAPAFAGRERALIRSWSSLMNRRGIRTEITRTHMFLKEALHVLPLRDRDSAWLVHKTPDGSVAVRRWPGIAQIVPTMSEALAIVGGSLGAAPPVA
jgi:hypothetical protein